MKRLFAICLVASMLALPLVGCGGGDAAKTDGADTTKPADDAPK